MAAINGFITKNANIKITKKMIVGEYVLAILILFTSLLINSLYI
jgi:hypothetical protein